jgi:hypothetical protein
MFPPTTMRRTGNNGQRRVGSQAGTDGTAAFDSRQPIVVVPRGSTWFEGTGETAPLSASSDRLGRRSKRYPTEQLMTAQIPRTTQSSVRTSLPLKTL